MNWSQDACQGYFPSIQQSFGVIPIFWGLNFMSCSFCFTFKIFGLCQLFTRYSHWSLHFFRVFLWLEHSVITYSTSWMTHTSWTTCSQTPPTTAWRYAECDSCLAWNNEAFIVFMLLHDVFVLPFLCTGCCYCLDLVPLNNIAQTTSQEELYAIMEFLYNNSVADYSTSAE